LLWSLFLAIEEVAHTAVFTYCSYVHLLFMTFFFNILLQIDEAEIANSRDAEMIIG